MSFACVTAGASLTYGVAALFSEDAQTRLAVTGDVKASFQSTGKKDLSLVEPVEITGGRGRYVYASIVFDGASTIPSLAAASALGGGTATAINGGYSPPRLGTQSGQASMPSSLTLSDASRAVWVGLS